MKTCSARIAAVAAVLFACANVVHAGTIAFFDFNSTTTPLIASQGSGSVSASSTAMNFSGGSSINAQGSAQGKSLGYDSGTANNGQYLTFSLSSSTFKNLGLSFAATRSGTGFSNTSGVFDTVSYSLTNLVNSFTNVLSFNPPSTGYELETVDLSSITALNNQTNVYFRVTFDGATSNNGTGRIDNFLLTGDSTSAVPLPPAVLAGTALFGVVGFLKRQRPHAVA